jgi:hypothetical protein
MRGMSEPMPAGAQPPAERATWLVWMGGAAIVCLLLLATAWFLLPRCAPTLAGALGCAIPPLTRPLAERCLALGHEAYVESVSGVGNQQRIAALRRARAYLQVARRCYGSLCDREPADPEICIGAMETNKLYYATIKSLPTP